LNVTNGPVLAEYRQSSIAGGRPLLSVSSEAASNPAFPGGPQRAERSHQSLANDRFDALVSQNTAPDPAPAPLPTPSPRRSDEPPPAAEAAHAANSPSSPPPGDNATRGDATRRTDADTPPATKSANGPADGGADQSQAAKTAGTKDDSAKATDQQTSGNTPAVDPTILAQQASVTTPVPAALSVNTAPTNVPAVAPTSGGSTPPLAIAAAAIAATSQTLAGQVTTPPQGTTDSGSGPTAPTSGPTVATNPALSAPGIKVAASVASGEADASPVISQARQLGTAPANTATLTSAVAASAPGAPKSTSGKTSASPVVTDSPNDADPTATNAPAIVPQNSQQQQPAATGKADAVNAAATLATSDAAATSPSSLSAHEHVPPANAGHPLTETADAAAQALGALQPQANSATAPATGGALNVTTAASGPVPLSGLALEIAASIKSGKSRFEIRLDPADLGRIDVRIDIDRNGQVTSHLTVEKPETLSILRQDAPQLQRALDDAGVKTGSGGLQFSLRDQSSSGQNNGGDSRPNAQRLIIVDEDTLSASVAGRSYGRSLAASGGVDIRV
jgi:flagellar hook-length control protein FliK